MRRGDASDALLRRRPPTDRAAELTRDPAVRTTFWFVALMASLGALNAFATDIVIPALGEIDREFSLADPNLRQWTIYAFFLGMAVSQLILGPVADRYGRRGAVFIGLVVYLAGAGWSAAAGTYEGLLAGRVLQGMGSGGMRVIANAIVRDRAQGAEMARILSLTNSVFVIMVLLAPFAGQWITEAQGWRWVFAWLAVQGALTGVWFALAQAETLRPENRREIRPMAVLRTLGGVIADATARKAGLALGACFGAFGAYLGAAEQIFGGLYGLETELPWAFGAISLLFGVASLFNAWAVRRFGLERLAKTGLAWWVLSGFGGAAAAHYGFAGVPPLLVYIGWGMVTISGFAALFGNLQALALQEMGDRAGSAASAISAFGTFCGVGVAAAVGAAYDGTVVPQAVSFGAAGLIGLIVLRRRRV
ncbi:MAG: MFS transporter [Pseudomonadota bacterium]